MHSTYILDINFHNSLETVDRWSCMDLQEIKCGQLTRILLLCLLMIPVENPLSTCYSDYLKKMWSAGHIGINMIAIKQLLVNYDSLSPLTWNESISTLSDCSSFLPLWLSEADMYFTLLSLCVGSKFQTTKS